MGDHARRGRRRRGLIGRPLPLTPEQLHPTDAWLERWREDLRARGRLDHSRSLSFSLAPAAIVVNRLCRAGALGDAHRDRILIELPGASGGSTAVPASEPELLEEVARAESEVHGERAAR